MCYVCRMEIKDYHHFANGGPQENEAAEKKCPLYSDTVKLHETEVARGATRAHQDLKSRNPHIRVDLVLADKWSIETEILWFYYVYNVLCENYFLTQNLFRLSFQNFKLIAFLLFVFFEGSIKTPYGASSEKRNNVDSSNFIVRQFWNSQKYSKMFRLVPMFTVLWPLSLPEYLYLFIPRCI